MASSGTYSNTFRTGYSIEFDWSIVSQNTSNNQSQINVKVYLRSHGSTYTISSSVSKSGRITIDGTTGTFSAVPSLSGNQRKYLGEYTRWVTHNTDGSKSCPISVAYDLQITLAGTYYGTVTVSGTPSLDSIDRGRINVKVSGSWRNGQAYIKLSGTWRQAKGVYVKVSGSWRQGR